MDSLLKKGALTAPGGAYVLLCGHQVPSSRLCAQYQPRPLVLGYGAVLGGTVRPSPVSVVSPEADRGFLPPLEGKSGYRRKTFAMRASSRSSSLSRKVIWHGRPSHDNHAIERGGRFVQGHGGRLGGIQL